MVIGSARGEDRAVQAAELAISSPLLEASIDGAHGVLLSIQGGSDLGLHEVNEAARMVQEAVHPEANIIFGTVIDDALGDEVRVTVIAAGFDGGAPQTKKQPGALGQYATANAAAPGVQPAVGAGSPSPSHALPRPVPEVPATTTSAQGGQTIPGGAAALPGLVPQPTTPVEPGSNFEVASGNNPGTQEIDVPDFLK